MKRHTHKKTLRLVVCLAWLVAISFWTGNAGRAEVFIGPSSSDNRLIVADDEAIVFSTITGNHEDTFPVKLTSGGLTVNAQVYLVPSDEDPRMPALAGPAEITVTQPFAFSFTRIKGSGIKSIIVPSGASYDLNVPEKKTIHLFRWFGYGYTRVDIKKGNRIAPKCILRGDEEFEGPLTISLSNTPPTPTEPPFPYALVMTYYFVEPATVLKEGAAIQAPTGASFVATYKSYDLRTWFPAIIQPVTNDRQAFYRIGITK